MALKHLKAEEMVRLSQPIVDPNHPEYVALMQIAETAVIVPHVANAHHSIVAIEAATPDPKRVSEISAQQAELDATHDDLRRGCYACLSGLAFLSRDARRGDGYRLLRDRLFPGGLSMTRLSYKQQAGAAILLEGKLDAATRASLEGIATPDGTMLDDVREIVSTGRRIGELEDEKVPAGSTEPSKDKRAADARNAWIKAINSLLAQIDLAATQDEDVLRLRTRIEDDAAKAGREKASSTTEQPAPTDSQPAEPVPEPA